MQNPKVLKRHAALVDRMAGALNVDLEEAMLRGEMEFDDIADAVLSCTACTNPNACEKWLDHHPTGARHGPNYCRNTGLFEALKEKA